MSTFIHAADNASPTPQVDTDVVLPGFPGTKPPQPVYEPYSKNPSDAEPAYKPYAGI